MEPSSHAPDGFNLAQSGVPGAGLLLPGPGGTLEGQVAIPLQARPATP